MVSYLIDTDICIFLLKNKFGIKEKIKEVGIENCFISEITLAELNYGAFRSEQFEKHIKEVGEIDKLFGVVPIYECLTLFGKEKARLKKLGIGIPDFDLLIGITAVNNNMTLVTNNEKHFKRIEGITIENWTKK